MIRGTDLPIVCGKVIGKGDTAAGGSEISYATFGDVFMSANNEIGFTSTLSGPGSNGGKDQGAWSQVNSSGIGLVMKSRDVLGTATIASVNKLLLNRSDTMIVHAMLTGLGVTTFDNQAIYRDNGSVSTLVFRTGTAMPALGGGQPLAFTQVIQNNVSNRLAAACTLRPILGKTSATNDSGILWHDIGTLTTESVREGSTAGGTGFTYGQFSGRVAGTHAQLTYAAATNIGQAVFQKGFGSAEQVVAQTGAATQALGFAFSSFIGETSDENDIALMRVGLRSTSAPIVNSEGLWTGTVFSSPTRVMMKGDLIPGSSSVRIAKFINYWLINGNTMALVQLSGTGVTSANDQALLLSYAPPAVGPARVVTLMREGDLAPGCDTATIGVISRVEVDNVHGRYLVLATLAGAPAGTELALFRGHASYPMSANAEEALRRPVLSLRKGQLYSNQPGKLKSMSLPTSNVTASGAGGTGIGCAINTAGTPSDQPFATLVVEFDNGVRQIMEGKL